MRTLCRWRDSADPWSIASWRAQILPLGWVRVGVQKPQELSTGSCNTSFPLRGEQGIGLAHITSGKLISSYLKWWDSTGLNHISLFKINPKVSLPSSVASSESTHPPGDIRAETSGIVVRVERQIPLSYCVSFGYGGYCSGFTKERPVHPCLSTWRPE